MKINEIIRIGSDNYTGENLLKNTNDSFRLANFSKLEGNNDYYYYIDEVYLPRRQKEKIKCMVAIRQDNGFLIIGVLQVISDNINNVYNKRIFEVAGIVVDENYRGKGISNILYHMVLSPDYLDSILFAGDTQTTGGRAMWSSLYSKPYIEVTGWVAFYKDNIEYKSEYNESDFAKLLEKQGAAYFGENSKEYYFEFEVRKLPVKRELAMLIPSNSIKIYNTTTSGLMARYI